MRKIPKTFNLMLHYKRQRYAKDLIQRIFLGKYFKIIHSLPNDNNCFDAKNYAK